MNAEQIVAELEELEPIRRQVKADSLSYQRRDKEVVARYYGFTFEQVDLPFAEWVALRLRYEVDSGKQL